MSIVAFKKKSVIQYGTNRSGKSTNNKWINQGPYGSSRTITSVMLLDGTQKNISAGFSLEGGIRTISVGKDMKFSKNGTSFKGIYPKGYGGNYGKYLNNSFTLNTTVSKIDINGNQHNYIKPSVLSNKGMLSQKYRWINNGQYPNNWVQPNYTGNLVDNKSQGMFIQSLNINSMNYVDINMNEKYTNYILNSGQCEINKYKGKRTTKIGYTKNINRPQDSSDHIIRLKQSCNAPIGIQKPFPYAVQTGTGILTGGINVSSIGNSCNTSNTVLTPPSWYVN